jgi:putative FmdB family regulatory protein
MRCHSEVITMPTYDYRCRACRRAFQIVQTMSAHEKARPKCPKCKSTKVERVFTGAFVKTSKKS